MVRARESSLILLAALVGVLGGAVVAGMGVGVDILHEVFFQLSPGERLSGRLSLDPWLAVLIPLSGGIIFGIASEVIARWRPEREVDPIEANALHGGRMSLIGSMIVAAQTMWSSGVGASVGLEAGYTQIASGIASRIGHAFRLRRGDLRILVGCGAAAGIAGAFGAPLAGAFYGFELIIGSYSPTSLAPVGIAALIGFLVAQHFSPAELGVVAPDKTTIAAHDQDDDQDHENGRDLVEDAKEAGRPAILVQGEDLHIFREVAVQGAQSEHQDEFESAARATANIPSARREAAR